MDTATDSKALYMIVRGGFNLETPDGGREIKKTGDTIELTEDEAQRHGRNIASIATIYAGDMLPARESVNDATAIDLSDVELEPDISTPALVDRPIWDVVTDAEAGTENEAEGDHKAVDWSYILTKKVDLVVGIVRTADVSDLPSLRMSEMSNPAGPRARIIAAVDKRLALAASEAHTS